jgi:uncharacterized membrane protein
MIASESVRSFDELSARKGGPSRLVRDLASTVSRVSLVLLFSLATMGCSNLFFFKKSQPPVTQRELPKKQTDPIGASTSDRLRDDVTRGARPEQAPEPLNAVQPTQAQEQPQPQEPAAAPAAVPPVQNSVESDPRAVIDWLLKDRR